MIRLLSAPVVDWSLLSSDSRNLVKTYGYREIEPASFLIALQVSSDTKLTPSQAVRQPMNSGLHMLHFTFLADGPVSDFLNETKMSNIVLKSEKTVIGGTLAEWRDAVVAGSHERASTASRQVACEIYTLFQVIKLSEIWAFYRKVKRNDGTFSLIYKEV